jgi:AcrR family transcriptional regulator
LTELGWKGLTTNAIAERAGVNIGTLYQYFPNKEAIVNELQRRHTVAVHAELQKALKLLPHQTSLKDALTIVVKMVIAEHKVEPAVHKAIMEELPHTLRCMQSERKALQRQVQISLERFVQHVPDMDFAIYLISTATEGIIHDIVAEKPELLDNPDLTTELVAMFEGYLYRV